MEGLWRDLNNFLKIILAASDAGMNFAMDFSGHSINPQLSSFHQSICIAPDLIHCKKIM